MLGKLIEALYIIAIIVFSWILSFAIHEFGHFVMGKLCGYHFVSYRIGPFAITKKDGQLKMIKQGGITGTGGQCIMLPPDTDHPENAPAVAYHLGGGLFNLLTTAISIMIFLVSQNTYAKEFLVIMASLNGALAMINLTPAKIKVPNDGYNVKCIIKNTSDRISIYNMLRIMGHTDLSPSEMPKEYFTCHDDGEYASLSHMMRGYYLLDQKQYKDAEDQFRYCIKSDTENVEYYNLEAGSMVLLCLLMRQAEPQMIDEAYNETLKQYIDNTKATQIDKRCILYAYHLLYKKDKIAADTEYNEMLRLRESISNKGDAKMYFSLADTINSFK